MQCPYCDMDNDKVIDSRATDGGQAIRRRRECLACGKRFTTYEHIEQTVRLSVIKRDGTRVPFERTKVASGIEKACYKRPVSAQQISQVVDAVEDELVKSGHREIDAVTIGGLVAEHLKHLDQVAYVRFASVYKQFRDLDDLLDEVRDMLANQPDTNPGQGKLF